MKKILSFILLASILLPVFSYAEIKKKQKDFSAGYSLNTSGYVLSQDRIVRGYNYKFSSHRKVHRQYSLGLSYEIIGWKYQNKEFDYYEKHPSFALETILTLRQFPNIKFGSAYLYAEYGIGVNLTVINFELGPPDYLSKTDFSPDHSEMHKGFFQPALYLGCGIRFPISNRVELTFAPEFHLYHIQKDILKSTCSFFNLNLGFSFVSKN